VQVSIDLQGELDSDEEAYLNGLSEGISEAVAKCLKTELICPLHFGTKEYPWPDGWKHTFWVDGIRCKIKIRHAYDNRDAVYYRLILTGKGLGYTVRGDGHAVYARQGYRPVAVLSEQLLPLFWDSGRYPLWQRLRHRLFAPMTETMRFSSPVPATQQHSLDDLLGLEEVKHRLHGLRARFNMASQQGKEPPLLHACIVGPPGTGKTTIAHLLADIYYQHGQLSKGHVITYNAGDLMAKYIGQTIPKTRKIIAEARGGLLLLDEAYVLASEGAQFAEEAVSALLVALEERDIAIVFAGYDLPMEDFLQINPGIRARIGLHLQTTELSPPQLASLIIKWIERDGYPYNFPLHQLVTLIEDWHRDENGRDHYASARSLERLYDRWIEEYSLEWERDHDADLTLEQLESALRG
jgi:hypothetical protein